MNDSKIEITTPVIFREVLMNNEITNMDFSVRFSDCNEYSRLKLSRLFQFMEEAAIVDAERNGYGLWNLMKAGYTYVITRMKVRLNHTPLLGEDLKVSTWTKEIFKDKVAIKDFSIIDGQGHKLVEGTSSWLLVNLATGKSEAPSASPFPVTLHPDLSAMPEMLDILPLGENPRVVYQEQARNSDMDVNHHVNHCRYVDWVEDCLSKEERKERGIRSLQLNYIHQVGLGEKVDIVRFKDSAHHTVIFGMNAEDMKKDPLTARCHFQARVGFGD